MKAANKAVVMGACGALCLFGQVSRAGVVTNVFEDFNLINDWAYVFGGTYALTMDSGRTVAYSTASTFGAPQYGQAVMKQDQGTLTPPTRINVSFMNLDIALTMRFPVAGSLYGELSLYKDPSDPIVVGQSSIWTCSRGNRAQLNCTSIATRTWPATQSRSSPASAPRRRSRLRAT
jgi:hypothetical protein